MQLFVLTIAICLALSAAKCPLGYVQGVRDDDCLKYFTDELSWDDAEDECRSAGGHLASSVSAFANSFLATLQSCGAEYWLGASKGELSNDWSWADGNSFNYKNWAKGEPKGSCLAQKLTDRLWYGDDCNQAKPYVCRVPALGEKPCPCDWTYSPLMQKCYTILPDRFVTWDVGNYKCQAVDANLTSIHSAHENQSLADLLLSSDDGDDSAAWIGLHAPKHKCDCQWTEGSPLDYEHCKDGNSTAGCNADAGKYCARLDPSDSAQWRIVACDSTPTYTVCEKAPKRSQPKA